MFNSHPRVFTPLVLHQMFAECFRTSGDLNLNCLIDLNTKFCQDTSDSRLTANVNKRITKK